MSSPLAIAAVTSTLQRLLDAQVKTIDNQSEVTTQPPDKATAGDNKLNLFLYHVGINAALRNNPELPGFGRRGEAALPPLALDLSYMLTAYGKGEVKSWDNLGHRLLGRAMAFLHDHPVLLREELRTALEAAQVHEQLERVRVTPQPLSYEEMSKLWTTFQTNYRLSVAYQVSVLLIESERPVRTPLPVLSIGADNAGVQLNPDLAPPLPTLTGIELPPWTDEPAGGLLPSRRPSVRLGETITLRGLHLDGRDVEVLFVQPRLPQPITRSPEAGATARALSVIIPNQPAAWPAGIYSVSVALTTGRRRRTTNSLPLVLAPRVTNRAPASTTSGDFALTVTCTPEARPNQDVRLLLGDRELRPNTFTTATATLVFAVEDATPGHYPLRLRVDGAESQLIRVTGSPPVPGFDPDQIVEVTP